MSTTFTINNIPVKIISEDEQLMDVDIIENKSCIVIGSSNTDGHAVVVGADSASSTRIMYGDTVAKLIQEDGETEVELWGNNVDRYAVFSTGLLVNLNLYVVTPVNPNAYISHAKYMLRYTKESADFPSYGVAAAYIWNTVKQAYVYAFPADVGLGGAALVMPGSPLTLDGLLITLNKSSIDVDEDGPYSQTGVGLLSPAMNTIFSVYCETLTNEYSAAMVETEETECRAIQLQENGGNMSAKSYKPLTAALGLMYLEAMRSVRYRSFAPDDVCPGVVQKEPIMDTTGEFAGAVDWIETVGKESNYSLSNLVERTEYIMKPKDEEIGLYVPCGTLAPIVQGSGSGRYYETGFVYVPGSGAEWGGMATYAPPRIKSYTPRYTHVEYDAATHTLSWQEQIINSYILFNNFDPDGELVSGVPAYGAGGYVMTPAAFSPRVEGEEGAEGTGVPVVPWM